GVFSFTPVDFSGISGYVHINSTDGADTVIVDGTSNNDVISAADGVGFAGAQSVIVNGHTQFFSSATAVGPALVLRGLTGSDTFNVDFDPLSPTKAGSIRVEGDGDDTLNYTAPSNAATTIDLGP